MLKPEKARDVIVGIGGEDAKTADDKAVTDWLTTLYERFIVDGAFVVPKIAGMKKNSCESHLKAVDKCPF